MVREGELEANVAAIKKQLRQFIDFTGDNAATLVNNADWTMGMSIVQFLRDIGKNFSLNTMLDRDTVKRRLESDGISYTEFSYMLLQANDFVHLNKEHDVVLQIGGSDRWGNMIAGVDLNRRVSGAKTHALTVPLVTDANGKKFGKSTGGGKLWLDPEKTSPYAWYQYFVNSGDADVVRYLKMFTFLSQEEIAGYERAVAEEPHKRAAQRRLAEEMTDLVHGVKAREAVQLASQALFGRADLAELDEATLQGALQETTVAEISAADPRSIVYLLVASGLVDSKGAARRTIKEGGAYVNNERIESAEWEPSADDLLHGSWLVLRRGKKNFAGAKVAV